MSAAGGGYTSRKFVTEELLTKLNTLLEQIARQQPPINPSVDAYKQEHDKVEYYLNELKKNPDDPYLRAQLHQAMDDRQHLYNLIQGNKNPFKTETSTSEGTQTQTQISTGVQTTIPQAQSASTGAQTTIPQTRSVGTQSDLLSEMERIREMFQTPPGGGRTRHQSGPSQSTEKPEGRTRHQSGPGSYQYVEKPHKKPPRRDSGYQTQTPGRPRPRGFPHGKEGPTPHRPPPHKPPRRQLVTGVKEWNLP